MNQNQKISIFDNPQLRKEIMEELAKVINKKLEGTQSKITENDIDDLIKNQQVYDNYQKAKKIKATMDNMMDIRENQIELISIDPDPVGLRWGYLPFIDGDTNEIKAQNRENLFLTQNKNTRKKLKNQFVLDELNIDIGLLFPDNDEEALEFFDNNFQLLDTGYLMTENDLLSDIQIDNPDLNSICIYNYPLLLTNYPFIEFKKYDNVLTTLIPISNLDEDTLFFLMDATNAIIPVLSRYKDQIKEFDFFDSKNTSPNIEISSFFARNADHLRFINNKEYHTLKEMYKAGIIQKGMPFQKVFMKDGKQITFSEAALNFDTKKKQLINGVTLENIDPEKLQRLNNIVKYDNVLANVAYFKHVQNDLKNKEYKGTYDELASSLEQYISLYDTIVQNANNEIAEDNNLNLNDRIKEGIIHNNDFGEIENKIKNLIPEFSKDIVVTNAKYHELDINILKLKSFYVDATKSLKKYKIDETTRDHSNLLLHYSQLDSQINSIEEQRILMSQSGNKEDIQKANEEYYKAFEELINTNIHEETKKELEDYTSDGYKFLLYMEKAESYQLNEMIQNMEYYISIDNPKDEFELKCLEQTKAFVNEYKDYPNQDISTLLNDETFKEKFNKASRMSCKHDNETSLKNDELNEIINEYRIDYFNEFMDNVNNNKYKNDYAEMADNIKTILNQLSIVDKELDTITCEAEKADVKIKKYTELFGKEPVYSFTKSVFIKRQSIDQDKKDFETELKEKPQAYQIKTLANGNSFKSANKLAKEALKLGENNDLSKENEKKIKEITDHYPNDPETSTLLQNYYLKNSDEYLTKSLQAIAIINFKDKEYNNKGSLGKWWYKNSHNEMLKTKNILKKQLIKKDIKVPNFDKFGFDDGKNSCSKLISQEIHQETLKENKFLNELNDLYNKKILQLDKNEKAVEFQNQVKDKVDIEKNIDIKEKVETKQIEQKQVQKSK